MTFKKFDVEYQYTKFLMLCNVTEEEMGEVQRTETKKAFVAGFAQCFTLIIEMADFNNGDSNKALDAINDGIKNTINGDLFK